MEIKGIDVSSNNGIIDWNTVAGYGMGFAILRVHQRNGIDSTFEYNYKGCKSNGIPVGVYKYSYAKTVAQAEQEAEDVLAVLNGRGLDFPVFYDLEWKEQRQLGSAAIEKIAVAFLARVQKAGYKVGIYCNVDWYNNVLTAALKKYDCWLAAYPANDNGELQERLRPSAGIGWQYSEKAAIPGIRGVVDRNVFYKDYTGKKEENNMANGQKAVDLAMSRVKKNQYTQSFLRVNVFSGYSDCSSLLWKCFEKAYGTYIGSWTGEQVNRGRRVLLCKNRYPYGKLTQEEINQMQIGDCIYYGSGDAYHVEMYIGDGKQIGHGSGIGPTIKNCLEYAHSRGVYQVRRFVADDRTKAPAITSSWKATGTAVCTSDDVNVRATPGGTVLRKVNKGNRFEVDGYVSNGWAHVNVAGTIGYIYEDYVKADKISDVPEENRLFVGKVTAETLNVRSWYGKDEQGQYYPKIKSYPELKKGNLIDVLVSYKYSGETWYKIRIAGKYLGFVSGAYVEKL